MSENSVERSGNEVKNHKQNIPELRFQEFDGEWNETKLGQISTIHDGTHGTHQNVEKGKYLLSAENIENGKVSIKDEPRIISEEDFNNIHKKYFIENGDVLLTIVGSIGRTAIVEKYNKEYTFQRSVAIINSKINSYFLNYYIQSPKVQKELKIRTNSSAQGGIYLKELSKIKINCPSDNEQHKIASLFLALDQKIDFMEMKLKTVKSFQNETLKNIFDNKDKDSTNWKKVPLNDLGIFYRGLSYNKDEVVEKGNVVLRSNNIKDNQLNFSPNELQYVSKEIKPELLLQKKDIVICMNNGSKKLVGKSAEYNENITLPITVGAFCSIFRPNNKLTKFLFRTETYKRNIYYIIAGSNINNLKNSEIGDFKFYIPTDINEENKIFELLTNLDKKTNFLEKEIEKNKQFKKSLLSKMFC